MNNAVFGRGNGDLTTACSGATALWMREALDTGWGDTYLQSLPGQSFDITNLPNATYYIRIVANPDNHLYERTTKNNTSSRQIILGGTTGARTVTVPPYHGVTTEGPLPTRPRP